MLCKNVIFITIIFLLFTVIITNKPSFENFSSRQRAGIVVSKHPDFDLKGSNIISILIDSHIIQVKTHHTIKKLLTNTENNCPIFQQRWGRHKTQLFNNYRQKKM